MDYPSVEQLATAYSQRQRTTSVIFASAPETLDFYESVASQFKSALVAELKTDSSNILEVVKSEFARIVSRMEIEKTDTTDGLHFKYFSSCSGTGGPRETRLCENLPHEGNVTFTVEIDFGNCPTEKDDSGEAVTMNPVGLSSFYNLILKWLC